jgi:SAM-dependent methyltransferase
VVSMKLLTKLLTPAMVGPLKGAVLGARQWRIYSDFLSPDYQRHNVARLEHLDSLGLVGRGKSVLEVGAGVGDHTLYYLFRGCTVTPTDGRPELVEFIRRRLGVNAQVLDVDMHPEAMRSLGKFDILHCYGLLYHLSRPEDFLRETRAAADLLLLETVVSWGDESAVHLASEDRAILSQAMHGGCRPTRRWIFDFLRTLYPHVYVPKTQPRHVQFPLEWDLPRPAVPLTRAIFVASDRPIDNPLLVTELPSRYDPAE